MKGNIEFYLISKCFKYFCINLTKVKGMYRKFQRQRGPGAHLLSAKTGEVARVRVTRRMLVCVFSNIFVTGNSECQTMLTGYSLVTPFLIYAPNSIIFACSV